MSRDVGGGPAKRPRALERARVGWPRALQELKDLLYEVYLAAEAPSLTEIAEDVAADSGLAGAPSRDTVRRCISDPVLPPAQADAVAVAVVLARRAAWDTGDLAARVRGLWVNARMASGAGRPLGEFNDPLVLADLEVHPALEARGDHSTLGSLPAYVPRGFDAQLDAVVASAAAGHSAIAVLVGGSSTGKTRALWEAVRKLPASWRLWHPLSPIRPGAVLAELPEVAPRTVVWLNEAQLYLSGDGTGDQVAAGLRSLLHDTSRGPVLVLATLWPEHWETLTYRGNPDRHAHARELLNGHRIDVPQAFTDVDLAVLAGTAESDPRLTEAATRATGRQVTQYLAGVPVLMDRYRSADKATQALFHAAMDAYRLGTGPHLPLAWLAEAAPGYLTDADWSSTSEDWLPKALEYASRECNGIPGILTPVKQTSLRNQRRRSVDNSVADQAVPYTNGPQYQLADYLDQYGRHHRAEEIPPVDFWNSAVHHAHPADWYNLGHAAYGRGLYRDAAQLFKHAAAFGHPYAPAALVKPSPMHTADHRPALWAVSHTSLDDPYLLSLLLNGLLEIEAREQIAALLDRAPAAHVVLRDPAALARFLNKLMEVDAAEQIAVLVSRSPASQVPADSTFKVRWLLNSLCEVQAWEQVAVLAERASACVSLDSPYGVAQLLDDLVKVAADEYTAVRAARAAAQTALDDPYLVAEIVDQWWTTDHVDQMRDYVAGAISRLPADNPFATAKLLDSLQNVRGTEQIAALLERGPGAHAPLDNPYTVAKLLDSLRQTGATEQIAALLERGPGARVSLDNPYAVARLVDSLGQAGATEQAQVLAARASAHALGAQARPTWPRKACPRSRRLSDSLYELQLRSLSTSRASSLR